MAGCCVDIKKISDENNNFREVLFTGSLIQMVMMSLEPGEDLGIETHLDTDQFIRVEKGEGKALLDGKYYKLEEGAGIFIPAGAEHNVTNTSTSDRLKLCTVYSPPEHPGGTIHKTKAESEAYEDATYYT